MTDSKKTSETSSSGWGQAAAKAFDAVAAVRMFIKEIKDSITEHWDWLLRRVEYLFVVYMWISVGILLMILGVFDLIINYGRVPKGVVYSIGGLLIFLVAIIFLQAAKMKRWKK